MAGLYEELLALSENGRIPFHMPGHARRDDFEGLGSAARIDFTEIDGLDNLHAPEGILRDAMERAAKVWGADRAFFLVGGSTVGMLAAVRALCKGGRPLLLARNAHRSAYHAALLARAPLFTLPSPLHPLGFALDVSPEAVRRALDEHPEIRAVAVTSPTYDGIVSDIAAIAAVCHERGIPLLVDAAHGAHLGFLDPGLPSPVSCGADVTVMSLHKTLPALTGTALLCVRGSLADPEEIAAALQIFETSSPSYPLMASADSCAGRMGDAGLFAHWRDVVGRIRQNAGDLLLRPRTAGDDGEGPAVFGFDESKLLLRCPPMTGGGLAAFLRSRNIEPEMIAPDYVLLMTTAGTTDEHASALIRALSELPRPDSGSDGPAFRVPPPGEKVTEMWTAAEGESLSVLLEDAVGRIGAEFLVPYPPGIPLLVPGERIGGDLPEAVRRLSESGCAVHVSRGHFGGSLRVVKEAE